MKNLLFSILIVLTFFAYSSDACTLQGETLSNFDTTEYIFIAKVVGYAKSLKIPTPRGRAARGQASGLIVEVKEKVYLPATPAKHFEIFPFGLGADCSPLAVSKTTLLRDFPLNSEIRVIADEAEVFPSVLPGGNRRLEVHLGSLSSLALNIDEKGKRMTSVSSVFEYESFVYNLNTDSESKLSLPSFEIRKDLFRLHNSKNQMEKNAILEKFLKIPAYVDELDFSEIFKTYASSSSEAERFDRARLKATMP